MDGLKNFYTNKSRGKQRYSEECVECKRQGKSTRVYEPIVRCFSCGGPLCRNHGTGIVMMGGKNGGKCDTCARAIGNFAQQGLQPQPQVQMAETVIKNIRTAQKLIDSNQSDSAEKIIKDIFIDFC